MKNRIEGTKHEPTSVAYQLDKSGKQKLEGIFRNATYWLKAYSEIVPSLFLTLDQMGANTKDAQEFLLKIAQIDNDSSHNFGILPAVIEIIGELKNANVPYTKQAIDLLFDSMELDHVGDFLYYDYYRKKISRTLISLEEDSDISKLEKLLIARLKAKRLRVGIGAHTSQVNHHQNESGATISAEYFLSEAKLEIVRVGRLLFLDQTLQQLIPSNLLRELSDNIIFLPSLDDSEFGGRLGYYTCNTLASLMASNLQGLTILDCGSGSGVLAIAAKRLGAAKVIGVDVDEESINMSQKVAHINGYTNSDDAAFLKIDLRKRQKIISLLGRTDSCRLGIISNIGHWPDYPISNITTLSYIPELADLRKKPEFVILGGYGNKDTRHYDEEAILLKRQNINLKSLPDEDIDADTYLLSRYGYTVTNIFQSEELRRPGYFAHQAKSLIATPHS